MLKASSLVKLYLLGIAAGVTFYVGCSHYKKYINKNLPWEKKTTETEQPEEEVSIVEIKDPIDNEEDGVYDAAVNILTDSGLYVEQKEEDKVNYNAAYRYSRKEDEPVVNKPKPYQISPDEYYERANGYNQITLHYFTDGILAEDNDDIADDMRSAVGDDFKNHFGDYEESVVYIRNDELKTEFEIIEEDDNYRVITGRILDEGIRD